MHIIDRKDLILFIEKNKVMNNSIIHDVNSKIDGRVCLTDYLNVLLSLKLLMKEKCKVYVEIGTLWGGSVCSLLQLPNYNTEYFCIDLYNGYYSQPTIKNDWNKCSVNVNEKNHLEFTNKNIEKFNIH